MTTDEGVEDSMSPECNYTAIVWVRTAVAVVLEAVGAVVEGGFSVRISVPAVCLFSGSHLAEIPEFHPLVLSVGEHVSPIAFTVDIGHACNYD